MTTLSFRKLSVRVKIVLSIFNAIKLGNYSTQQAATGPVVVHMPGMTILMSLSFTAKTAEVASKLMHDVETNPGPNCSGVSSFIRSLTTTS